MQNDQGERYYRITLLIWSITDITYKKKHAKGEKSFKSGKKSVDTNISPGDANFKRFSLQNTSKDLNCRAYKKRIEPLLIDIQKSKRIQFENWVQNNFRKEDTLLILFLDEKIFDINGLCNVQNERIWVINCEEADNKGVAKKN